MHRMVKFLRHMMASQISKELELIWKAHHVPENAPVQFHQFLCCCLAHLVLFQGLSRVPH